ncbi:unnamed protein product, partial [Tilletia caries]
PIGEKWSLGPCWLGPRCSDRATFATTTTTSAARVSVPFLSRVECNSPSSLSPSF